MSRQGGEICQVDLFIKPSPVRCTLECSFPQCMPKHGRPPLQVLDMVCFSFQLFVVWLIHVIYCLCEGGGKSNKLPFGKWSDTCWKTPTCPSRFCPAATLTCTFPLPPLPACIGSGGCKESTQKTSPNSASKTHWSQRTRILGRQRVMRLLRQKLKHRYALLL